jgi:hypothetical protein
MGRRKKLYCAVCGGEIEEGDIAIRIGDIVSADEEEAYIHEDCAIEWLERECETVEITEDWLEENL